MSDQDAGDDGPLYPVNRSFVVQLTRAEEQSRDVIAGKIEHVASGQAIYFSTLAELGEFLRTTQSAPIGLARK